MQLPDSPLGLARWVLFAQRRAADEWIRDRGLSMEQGFTLRYLLESPGAMQRDIAATSRTSAASVSSMLQGLERRGLVERRVEQGDERSKRVHATPAAAELLGGFDAAMAEVDDAILSPLTDDERTALRDLLHKVAAELPEPVRT